MQCAALRMHGGVLIWLGLHICFFMKVKPLFHSSVLEKLHIIVTVNPDIAPSVLTFKFELILFESSWMIMTFLVPL